MCKKAPDNYHALVSVSNSYKTQKMCDKAAKTYSFTIQFAPNRFKTHEMCDNAVNSFPFIFDSIPY